MKKNYGVLKIFVVGLIFSSMMTFSENCSAVDYYVGNYRGAEKYLMTETIKKIEKNYSDGTGIIDYYFKLKAVYNGSVQIDEYHFDFPSGAGFFKVNGKPVGSGDNEHFIIEKNIIHYITKYYR